MVPAFLAAVWEHLGEVYKADTTFREGSNGFVVRLMILREESSGREERLKGAQMRGCLVDCYSARVADGAKQQEEEDQEREHLDCSWCPGGTTNGEYPLVLEARFRASMEEGCA